MRDSGSVKLYWSLACGSAEGGVGGRPRGLRPVRWALASRSCCLASYSACWPLALLNLPGGLAGLGQTGQTLLAQDDLVGHVHACGYFVAIGLFGQPKQLIDFGTQAAFQFQQALVATALLLEAFACTLEPSMLMLPSLR